MAKTSDGMAGEKGMSPRKMMAGGAESGNFGVGSFEKMNGNVKSGNTGMATKGHMADHQRGIGMSVKSGGDTHPNQAAPDHGPQHVGGYPR